MVLSEKIEKDSDIIGQIVTREAIVRMRRDGIVHVTFKRDTLFDIGVQMKMLQINNEITKGVKSYFIFDAEENVVITKEARDNATKIEHLSSTKATAVIANNLAYRLVANFYIKFNKPKTPYKVFANVEDAVKWFKSLPA